MSHKIPAKQKRWSSQYTDTNVRRHARFSLHKKNNYVFALPNSFFQSRFQPVPNFPHGNVSLNRFSCYFFTLRLLSRGTERPSPSQMECHLTTHPKINGLNSNASVDNSNLIPKLFKMPKQHLWKEARAGCYTGTFGAMCFVVSLLHNKYPFHEYSSILAHYREQGLKIASAWAWTCSQLHTDTRLSSPAMERKKEKKSWNNDLSFPLSCRNRGMAGALRSLNCCVVTKLVFLEL